jgi:DeoR/GlpR family transcriptional regulator of sugar metabolism
MLPGIGSVTVLSNFRLLLNELAAAEDVRLVGLGGDYDARFATYTGPLCREMVSALRPDLYITSTTAVDGTIAFHPDAQIADVKRAMLAAAARSVLLLDHTKLGHRALHRVASIGDFDEIYVDEAAPAAVVRQLREAGTEVTVVPVPSPSRSAGTKGTS